MDITGFTIAWIVAISIMSSFSSLWSTLTGNEFREHVLLSHLLTKGDIPLFSAQQRLIGWVIHILLGAVFLVCYEILWKFTGVIRSAQWSLIFGVLIGIVGIIGWMMMFKLHKNPPKINNTHYYIHLLFAHIVFSIAAWGVYNHIN